MARHHFVPQFLLRNWANPAGQFVAYYFVHAANKVIERNASVASACQIRDLNSYMGLRAPQRDFPETGFFSPRVDSPAARALQVIQAKGVRALTPQQRIDWARLLLSFAVRTPEMLRVMGPKETKKAFETVEALAKGPPADERKVSELIKQGMPTLERNFPLNIAMDLCTDPAKLAKVDAMQWWVRRWPRSAILIGDRPLLTFPRVPYPCGVPLDSAACLIALPIAPDAVFFASGQAKTKDKMRTMALSRIALTVNEETIWRSTVVHATDKSLAAFVTPRVQGKATGTWQPGKL
jgi:hypothetical protein